MDKKEYITDLEAEFPKVSLGILYPTGYGSTLCGCGVVGQECKLCFLGFGEHPVGTAQRR